MSNSGKLSVAQVGKKLHRSYSSVSSALRRYDISYPSLRNWNDKELDYAASNIGIKSNEEIAKRLGRTVKAIETMCHRNRWKRSDNFYSLTLLSNELGVSRKTIKKFHREGLLKGKYADYFLAFRKRPMIFTQEDVERFLSSHPYRMAHLRRIPNVALYNIWKDAIESQLLKKGEN